MSHVTVGAENGADIEIYYEDHGSGQPWRAARTTSAGPTRTRSTPPCCNSWPADPP